MTVSGKQTMINALSLVRQEKVVHILIETERASIQELSAQLGVSSWTLRRDLVHLEKREIVRRYHGGVALADASIVERINFEQSTSNALEAKQRIGRAAAGLLVADQSIVLGGGTTTTEVARHLKLRKCLRIMTNSLNIALELSHNADLEVTCTGGTADSSLCSLTGSVAERALSAHYFDVAVIGVGGINTEVGLTVSSQANALVLSLMIEHSRKCIVVADHTKFGQVCFAHLAPLSRIDTLVTDMCPSSAFRDALRGHRMRLMVVDEHDWAELK
jgi:DeoR/GlpR family transcriptional regulator of sugar metabolism